jgi:MraZ protein
MANFMGSYTYSVDHKGRVSIPTKFRKYIDEDADEALIITRGLDGCLFAYPIDEWQRIDERLRALPVTQQNTRVFVRMLTATAISVTLDKQGRIAIPRGLLELAGIESDVFFVGTLDHFELWNPSEYDQLMNESGQSYESIAETILM